MKNKLLKLFLILSIILLVFFLVYSKNIKQELSLACRGDKQCIEQIQQLNSEQLEQIKRETLRCNNSPDCIELYTFGAADYVKPNQHILIPKTHDVVKK